MAIRLSPYNVLYNLGSVHRIPLGEGRTFLLNGMLHVIIKEGLIDEDFIRERTVGWAETKALLEQYPPERVAKVCGLKPEVVVKAARMYGYAEAALIYTARGLEHQSKGVDNGVAAANLALATGNFGRPGAGNTLNELLSGQTTALGWLVLASGIGFALALLTTIRPRQSIGKVNAIDVVHELTGSDLQGPKIVLDEAPNAIKEVVSKEGEAEKITAIP